MLARINSIRRPKLPQLQRTIQATLGNDGGAYEMNEYIHQNFFHGDNYQSILKCLDDGYHVMKDQEECMEEYCTLLRNVIESLKSYSKKWKSKVKHQSTISSYYTTKQIQMEFLNSPVQLSQLIQTRVDEIEQVISSYHDQIHRLYHRERFGPAHKHYQTDSLKKKFQNAYASLSDASKLVDEIEEEKTKAEKSLRQARIELQNLELDPTPNPSKITKANQRVERKEKESQAIDDKLTRAKDDVAQEEKIYREKAMEIYGKCREYESERLNLIRETLMQFIRAIHSTDQDVMYEKLLARIESQHNTQADLDFWAETYHISRSISTETLPNTTTESTVEEATSQSIIEPEEDRPITTTMKTKAKRK